MGFQMINTLRPTDAPTSSAPFTLSLVVPVHNEAKVLPELLRRSVASLQKVTSSFEIILVNDGSTDSSLDVMRTLRDECDAVAIVNLSRNFGKEAALTAGLHYSGGDAVVVIDADLHSRIAAANPSGSSSPLS